MVFFPLMPVFIDFGRGFVGCSSSPPKILCPCSKLSAWKPDSCVSNAVPDSENLCRQSASVMELYQSQGMADFSS